MLDADVERAGVYHVSVEFIVVEPIRLLMPLRMLVLQTVDFLAGLAVFVPPNHDVEILVVGVVKCLVVK